MKPIIEVPVELFEKLIEYSDAWWGECHTGNAYSMQIEKDINLAQNILERHKDNHPVVTDEMVEREARRLFIIWVKEDVIESPNYFGKRWLAVAKAALTKTD